MEAWEVKLETKWQKVGCTECSTAFNNVKEKLPFKNCSSSCQTDCEATVKN